MRHVSFEGPAILADLLDQRGYSVKECRLYRGEPLPSAEEIDVLISMGGPMSVHDTDEFPWLGAERRLMGECLAAGRPVLGVCLGAQQLALALGGDVVASPEREIGWYPIAWLDPPVVHPAQTVLHWHGEMAVPPPEARVLAGSPGCPTQAFEFGSTALGLQFHVEMDSVAIEAILAGAGDELNRYAQGRYVSDLSSIRRGATDFAAACHRTAAALLDRLLEP